MKKICHLVVETPGVSSLEILRDATIEDKPLPLFLQITPPDLQAQDETICEYCQQKKIMNFRLSRDPKIKECFILLPNHINLADLFEAFGQIFRNHEDCTLGRILFFIDSNSLMQPPAHFQDWMDGVSHFTDVMLFTSRTNENASCIKNIQDRYKKMHYPMESFILGKKNAPWARILECSPRRLTHIFDDLELLDPEDLPENDRYLARTPTGERVRMIPLVSASKQT